MNWFYTASVKYLTATFCIHAYMLSFHPEWFQFNFHSPNLACYSHLFRDATFLNAPLIISPLLFGYFAVFFIKLATQRTKLFGFLNVSKIIHRTCRSDLDKIKTKNFFRFTLWTLKPQSLFNFAGKNFRKLTITFVSQTLTSSHFTINHWRIKAVMANRSTTRRRLSSYAFKHISGTSNMIFSENFLLARKVFWPFLIMVKMVHK